MMFFVDFKTRFKKILYYMLWELMVKENLIILDINEFVAYSKIKKKYFD